MKILYLIILFCSCNNNVMSMQDTEEHKLDHKQISNKTVDANVELTSNTLTHRDEMTQSLKMFLKNKTTDAGEHVPIVERDNSVESVLLGNQTIIFATPFLESYTKKSVLCWNVANALFEDLEALSHGVATGLIAYSGALQNGQQSQFATLAVQMGLIAHAIQKLASFSAKVIPIREKQALGYQQMNRLNLHHASIHDLSVLHLNSHHDTMDDSNYSTKSLESLYTCCAVYKNIAWDQLGVYVILLQTGTYSIVNWANTTNDEKLRHKLLVYAIFCSITGTFLQYYVKHLSKNVPKMEHKALLARTLNQAGDRIHPEHHAAPNNAPNTMASIHSKV